MSMREAADYVASRGRYGDTEIMHVNPLEIEMLEQAGVPLTINPETGKKEAFLPILMGLGGAALGATGATASLGALGSTAAMGALGSGLGSFIETGDLGQGIMSGLMGYGIGSLAGSALGGGAGALKEGAKAAASAPLGVGASSGANAVGPNAAAAAAMNANPAPSAASSMFDSVGNFITENPAMAIGGAAAALPLLSGGPGDPKKPSSAGGGFTPFNFSRQNTSGNASPTGVEQQHFTPGTFTPVTGFAEGGIVNTPQGQGQQAQQIMMEALMAIRGEHPEPRAAIEKFLAIFGADAFEELMAKAQGGEVDGGGDGMSDSIPAQINGQQPAALSDGEYVVPADVVSGIGNGSTDAGVQQLEQMGERVRLARGGGVQQPPALSPNEVMPT